MLAFLRLPEVQPGGKLNAGKGMERASKRNILLLPAVEQKTALSVDKDLSRNFRPPSPVSCKGADSFPWNFGHVLPSKSS